MTGAATQDVPSWVVRALHMSVQTEITLLAGRPFPQGASADRDGTNFSLWAPEAERVELCLFADDGEETRVDLGHRTAQQ